MLIGNGRAYQVLAWLCQPVVAGVAFNAVVIVTHIPTVVNTSVVNGPMHYGLHLLVVTLSLLMWMPVCGPFREFHLQPLGKCIYLFLQSVVPTLPCGVAHVRRRCRVLGVRHPSTGCGASASRPTSSWPVRS